MSSNPAENKSKKKRVKFDLNHKNAKNEKSFKFAKTVFAGESEKMTEKRRLESQKTDWVRKIENVKFKKNEKIK